MTGKLTLITPPDFYENLNTSVLFLNLTESEYDTVGGWLKERGFTQDINLYVYSGEPNIPWLFYANARCEHKYLNLDNLNAVTNALSGYLIGSSDLCYKTSDAGLANIYSHINNNRVNNIEEFLERVIDVKK